MPNKPLTNLSRVDKLRVDRDKLSPEESRALRAASVPTISAGDDIATSENLQIALLTAVNLTHRSFNSPVPVKASEVVWNAKCLAAISTQERLGDALKELGATEELAPQGSMCLLLGSAPDEPRALRLTFDGWRVGVGPAHSMARMQERPLCPLAAVASAAIGVGEAFSLWAGINVAATRRDIKLSLWRPDLEVSDPESLGCAVHEFPMMLELFGLGHLGQAYLWSAATLPFTDKSQVTFYLCDDDVVEQPNLETGALLAPGDINERKTRAISTWLGERGFSTRLIERFIDANYRKCGSEPSIALSGFDNNEARHWLSAAGFDSIIDSGLGGEASNFDSVAVRTWPHVHDAHSLWPLESDEDREKRVARQKDRAEANAAYKNLAPDDCGRLLVSGKAVAVPFVGAVASTFVLAELLRACNGGPVFYDARIRVCSLTDKPLATRIAMLEAAPVRGLKLAALRQGA